MKKISILTIGILFMFSLSNLKAQTTGTFEDKRDGKIYKTVEIGEQVWMAENLAFKADSGYWAYDNDESNVARYGFLYNFETARNACPSGWHLPTDEEWQKLEIELGMSPVDANNTGYRGSIADKFRSEKYWKMNGSGTNENGFNVIPAGYRDAKYNMFLSKGNNGYFWSDRQNNNSKIWIRNFVSGVQKIGRQFSNKDAGVSVRCVKN